MSRSLSRRDLLARLPGGLAFAATPSTLWLAGAQPGAAEPAGQPPPSPELHPEFPSQNPERVRDVVAKAHTDLEGVRALVTASPALAKAAWDWGFGDWESALGAASHMGRRDIAELLIEHGARPDLFTFAMLGHLDTVRSYVRALPGIQRIPGPHGITLLQHAVHGGDAARPVAAYLESLGDADERATSLAVTDEQKQAYLGRYEFGRGADDALEVVTNRSGALAIRRGNRFGRVLNRVEEHGFAPSGAPDVRVRFVLRDGRAVSLTVHDPHPLVVAKRAS